jgi:hypothetical protein
MRLKCRLIVFTNARTAAWLLTLRDDDGVVYVIEEEEEKWFNHRWREYYEQSHAMDVERHLHSPRLSMLWNEKAFFLQRGVRMNPFASKWFLWTDIGSLRDISLLSTTYPSERVLSMVPEDKMLLFQVEPFAPRDREKTPNGIYAIFANQDERTGCERVDRIQATCFGGTRTAVERWAALYAETLELLIAQGTFIGKEQNNMTHVALDYPEAVYVVAVPHATRADRWFWFYEYLS